MKLSKTARTILTVAAASLAAVVATAPSEQLRVGAGIGLTVLAAVGIYPPHVDA